VFYIYITDEQGWIVSISEKEETKTKNKDGIETSNKQTFIDDGYFVVDELDFDIKLFWNELGLPKYKLVNGELVETIHPNTNKILLERESQEILTFLLNTDYVVVKLQENQLIEFLSEEEIINYTNTLTERQEKRVRLNEIDTNLGNLT